MKRIFYLFALLVVVTSCDSRAKKIASLIEKVKKTALATDPKISSDAAKLMYKLENDKLEVTKKKINSDSILFDYMKQPFQLGNEDFILLLNKIKSIDPDGFLYVKYKMNIVSNVSGKKFSNFAITLTGLDKNKGQIKVDSIVLGNDISKSLNYSKAIVILSNSDMKYFYRPENNLGGVIFKVSDYLSWATNKKVIYLYPVLETNMGNPFLTIVFSNVPNLKNVVLNNEPMILDATFADRGQTCCQ